MFAILVPAFPVVRLEKFCLLGNGERREIPRSDLTRGFKDKFHGTLQNEIHSIANPICVWHLPPGGGEYVLKYGQSRVEAALRAKYPYLPAIVSGSDASVPDFQGAISIDLTENPPRQFLGMFRDPPHKWWVHSSGHLEFCKCLGEFERKVGKYVPPRPW